MTYQKQHLRQRPAQQTSKPARTRKRKRYKLRIFFALLFLGLFMFGVNKLIAMYVEIHANVVGVLLPLPPLYEPYVAPEPEYNHYETAPANERDICRTIELYLNFIPPTYTLDKLLSRHGNNISVYFENMETGFVYRFNADRVYFSASVPKAMYALYIYKLAERGIVDLDSMHEFTYADANWGSGVIQRRYDFGATFSLRELLRLNISESDNVATLMLRRIHGLEGYRNFISEIGGNPNLVGCRVMNSNLTANEAGLFAREIFAYIASGGRYSHELKAHLLDNQFPFMVSDYPIASKTGWTSPIAWHDMAIVYAPSPFVLVILSARYGWTDADYADFAEISMAFQQFNDTWFVN